MRRFLIGLAALGFLACDDSSGEVADVTTDTTSGTDSDTHAETAGSGSLRVFLAPGFVPVASGVSGADAFCMAHSAYPGNGTFKAFLGGPSRQACADEDCASGTAHVDWILVADRAYVRADDSLALWTTDANALIVWPMANPIADGINHFSGFTRNWLVRDIHCSDWTTTEGEAPVGWTSTLDDGGFLSGGQLQCSSGALLCVEQP